MDTIKLFVGEPFSGHMLTDSNGQLKVEGDISTQRWREGIQVANSVAAVLARVAAVASDRFEVTEAIFQTGKNEMRAALEIKIPPDLQLDRGLVTAVTMAYTAGLTGNRQYDINLAGRITQEVVEVVNEELKVYETGHPRKRLNHQLEVNHGKEVLTVMKGMLIGTHSQKTAKHQLHEAKAYYDGRQLRDRKLFLVINGSRRTNLELRYDEARFDAKLRSLNENKNAELEILYSEIIEEGGSEYLQLEAIKSVTVHSDMEPDLLGSP